MEHDCEIFDDGGEVALDALLAGAHWPIANQEMIARLTAIVQGAHRSETFAISDNVTTSPSPTPVEAVSQTPEVFASEKITSAPLQEVVADVPEFSPPPHQVAAAPHQVAAAAHQVAAQRIKSLRQRIRSLRQRIRSCAASGRCQRIKWLHPCIKSLHQNIKFDAPVCEAVVPVQESLLRNRRPRRRCMNSCRTRTHSRTSRGLSCHPWPKTLSR